MAGREEDKGGRAREREDGYRRRDRSFDRDRERDQRDGRGSRRVRERSRSPDRRGGRRDARRSRSRSRSPRRDDAHAGRARTRTRSPPPRGSRRTENRDSRAKAPKDARTNGAAQAQPQLDLDGLDEEEKVAAQMRAIMNFSSFKSTKNTKVEGNDRNYGVSKEKKTQYRQYMNRTGGFNRPLSPS